MNNFLITGSSSGLGKYLHQNLGGASFNRKAIKDKEADIIIHCAFNRARDINSQNLYQYLADNVFLTKRLTKIPHKKFIYISSIDVYPQSNEKHFEGEVIDIDKVSNMYGFTKLASESLIRNLCPNFLILRCAALLGKDSNENSLIKISKEARPTLTLSSNSVFNYILHKDVLEFIKLAIGKDLQGIYNLASSKNIALTEVAAMLGKKVDFGNYVYNTGKIENSKITSIFPAFKKTSKEVILEFTKINI